MAAKSRSSQIARSAPITIVLADPLNLVRGGIRCLIEMQDGFTVIGEAADGPRVIRLVRRLRPRILIVAVAMPGLNGLEVTRQVSQESPRTAVIILATQPNDQYVFQALRNGASGYVVKGAEPAELARAMREVAAGRRYLSKPLSAYSIATWLRRAKSAAIDAYERLTPREREVLRLLSEGYTSARIGSRLSISPRTAESHRSNVMHKLRLRNLLDLVRFVLAREILSPSG